MQFLPESRTPYPSYFDPTSQTQYSQYPAYSEIIPDDRSSASAYTSQPYGSYPLDSRVGYTGADFGPIYAKPGYTPPPEPYESPTQSRSGNPQCTSSTLYATRVNTQYNKTSGLRREDSMSSALYNSPGYAMQHPLPPQAKGAPYSNMLPPRLVPQKTPLAVPPDPNLPPIPGTPMTVFLNRSSANASLRESEANDDNNNNAAGLTTGGRPRTTRPVSASDHRLFPYREASALRAAIRKWRNLCHQLPRRLVRRLRRELVQYLRSMVGLRRLNIKSLRRRRLIDNKYLPILKKFRLKRGKYKPLKRKKLSTSNNIYTWKEP